MSTSAGEGGMGFCMVLFLIFLTLKLLGKITWSWWWVTAPLWAFPVLMLAIFCFAMFMAWKFGNRRGSRWG